MDDTAPPSEPQRPPLIDRDLLLRAACVGLPCGAALAFATVASFAAWVLFLEGPSRLTPTPLLVAGAAACVVGLGGGAWTGALLFLASRRWTRRARLPVLIAAALGAGALMLCVGLQATYLGATWKAGPEHGLQQAAGFGRTLLQQREPAAFFGGMSLALGCCFACALFIRLVPPTNNALKDALFSWFAQVGLGIALCVGMGIVWGVSGLPRNFDAMIEAGPHGFLLGVTVVCGGSLICFLLPMAPCLSLAIRVSARLERLLRRRLEWGPLPRLPRRA